MRTSSGHCQERPLREPSDGLPRFVTTLTVPEYNTTDFVVPERNYIIARGLRPFCTHAYALTATAAAHLYHTSLPFHVLHPLSASLYSQPPNRWGPVDIWTANGPFYRTLRTLVVHPAMIYQMKGSNKGEGSEPVFSARWAGRSLRNEDEGEEKAQEAKEMWEVVHKEWGGKLGMGKA